jgi:WD40 repeat protein
LASESYDGQINIWDTMTGDLKQTTSTGGGTIIYFLKVLKNGDLAIAYNVYLNFYGIQIRDPASLALKANYTGHSDYVRDLVELPNGDLASASDDKTIKIWDRATGNVKKSLNFHYSEVYSLALLKNGLLASGSTDRTIVISKI